MPAARSVAGLSTFCQEISLRERVNGVPHGAGSGGISACDISSLDAVGCGGVGTAGAARTWMTREPQTGFLANEAGFVSRGVKWLVLFRLGFQNGSVWYSDKERAGRP